MKKDIYKLLGFLDTVVDEYDQLDNSHGKSHIKEVMHYAKSIFGSMGGVLDFDIVRAAVVYHDIGLLTGDRGSHHLKSAERVLADKDKLSEFFDYRDITIIAQACEDHRASSEALPRSIYGCIIADADTASCYDPIRLFERVRSVRLNISNDECEIFDNAWIHLNEKFSSNGYAKFWLQETKTILAGRIKCMHTLCDDKDLAWEFWKLLFATEPVFDGMQ